MWFVRGFERNGFYQYIFKYHIVWESFFLLIKVTFKWLLSFRESWRTFYRISNFMCFVHFRRFGDFVPKRLRNLTKKIVFFVIYLEEWILSQFCFDYWNIAKYNNKSVRLRKRRIWWNLMQELSFDFHLW